MYTRCAALRANTMPGEPSSPVARKHDNALSRSVATGDCNKDSNAAGLSLSLALRSYLSHR